MSATIVLAKQTGPVIVNINTISVCGSRNINRKKEEKKIEKTNKH